MSVSTNANANDISPISKVPLYEGSTQYRNWRYSTEQLTHIRAGLNEAAVAVIRKTFETDQVYSLLRLLHLDSNLLELLVRILQKCILLDG
jgi:cyclin H